LQETRPSETFFGCAETAFSDGLNALS